MDINKLIYFFSAAETGNFTKAADKCHIAQTTMSKYIKTLENEVGCNLFVRTNKNCFLTDQGKLFYDQTKSLYEEWREIMRGINKDESAELKIGLEGDFINVPLLDTFRENEPAVRFRFTFGGRDELLKMLQRQKVDAIVAPSHRPGDFDKYGGTVRIDMDVRKEVLICSGKLLEECGSFAEVIAASPLITKSYDSDYHKYCREMLDDHFGKTFDDVTVVDSYSRQMLLIGMANGFGIVPVEMAEGHSGLTFDEAGGIFIDKMLLVYSPQNVSAGLKKMIDYIEEYAPEGQK